MQPAKTREGRKKTIQEAFGLIKSLDTRDIRIISYKIAEAVHEGTFRDAGEPYITHPRLVAELTGDILKPTEYRIPAKCAGLLHDVIEEDIGINCRNPFRPTRKRNKKYYYLNNLLFEFGEDGDWICYMVDKITHRKNVKYMKYMEKIFSFDTDEDITRDLDMIVCIMKMCDRHLNTNPYDDIDPEKKMANAYDNLFYYIPIVRNRLLEETNRHDRRIFFKDELEDLLNDCYENSKAITKLGDKIILKVGYNRQ